MLGCWVGGVIYSKNEKINVYEKTGNAFHLRSASLARVIKVIKRNGISEKT